jgi:hypothetical protein
MAIDRRWAARVLGTVTVGLVGSSLYRAAAAIALLAAGRSIANDPAFRYPPWAVVHFVAATFFAGAVPVQLWAHFRNRHRPVHRAIGRVAAIAGLVAGGSGVGLAYAMPGRPIGERVFMTTGFSLLLLFLITAVRAARHRDFVRHRENMLRTAAVALGPMTHRLVFVAFVAGITSRADFWDRFLAAAWLSMAINLGLAEWWIRHTSPRQATDPDHPPVTSLIGEARAG